MGLQDQLIALRWLRTNLGAFGGDRDKVTLAGAGRAAAMAHLLAINARAAGKYSQQYIGKIKTIYAYINMSENTLKRMERYSSTR